MDISQNRLQQINELEGLNLQRLVATSNNIEYFPIIPTLEELYIDDNGIKVISRDVRLMDGLRVLNISFNSITYLPAEITELRYLSTLLLFGNNLNRSVPNKIIGQGTAMILKYLRSGLRRINLF